MDGLCPACGAARAAAGDCPGCRRRTAYAVRSLHAITGAWLDLEHTASDVWLGGAGDDKVAALRSAQDALIPSMREAVGLVRG